MTKQILKEMYPEKKGDFRYTSNWFLGFCNRYKISFRRITHAAQKSPAEFRESIENLHKKSIRVRRSGTYTLRDLGNMDHPPPPPAPFVMEDNKTYNKTGAKEVWVSSGKSELNKRQCTVQFTIFADGSTLPPLIIFRGQGLRINPAEKKAWDRWVNVLFQRNAWCDEEVMKRWTTDVGQRFIKPPYSRFMQT